MSTRWSPCSGIYERLSQAYRSTENINIASNDGDRSRKLNSIQLSQTVAVIVCDTLGACLRTVWKGILYFGDWTVLVKRGFVKRGIVKYVYKFYKTPFYKSLFYKSIFYKSSPAQ